MSRGSHKSGGSHQGRGVACGLNNLPLIRRWREAGRRMNYLCCECGMEANCWISWTDENPGRRFCSCSSGCCRYWCWNEGPLCDIAKQLILLLRDELIKFRRENENNLKVIGLQEEELRICKEKIGELIEVNERLKSRIRLNV